MEVLMDLKNVVSTVGLNDIVDILVISYLIYKIILFLKETRAEQVLKGIIAILILAKISSALNLYTVNWLLNNILTVGLILIIIVFQPEIRRAFEKIGRSNALIGSLSRNKTKIDTEKIDELVSAVQSLARQKIGALIVMEDQVGLSDIAETGTAIDADISSELLINIFIPNTPLHDGAVIIKNNRVRAAACFLPLSQNQSISKELGTRHRAAVGMSEKSDALVIVVSEETGTVSTVKDGVISRYIDPDVLRKKLIDQEYGEQGLLDFLKNNEEKDNG